MTYVVVALVSFITGAVLMAIYKNGVIALIDAERDKLARMIDTKS